MLPPATAEELNAKGHDAVSVTDVHLAGSADDVVYALALEQQRVVVTENFADFARLAEDRLAALQPCVPIVFVRKQDLPGGGGLAVHLARHLDEWSADNPEPYPGPHWP